MIVKMKKITLLLSTRERESALKKLRKLGLLHVRLVLKPQSEDIQSLETELSGLEKALQIIAEGQAVQKTATIRQVRSLRVKILDLARKRETFVSELEKHRQTQRWFENWGKLSYASLEALQDAGVYVRFYVANKGGLKKVSPERSFQIIREEGGTVRLVFFGSSPEDRLDFREEPIPQVEIRFLESRMAELKKEIGKINRALKDLSAFKDSFLLYREVLKKQLEFDRVLYSMGEEERFVFLEGFCPAESVSKIKKSADKEGWAYAIQDPEDPSEVPTLIRNPKWIRIIHPLFKFMGTLPGYEEKDVSFWFLLFFSLFFAMLIGDAGYGVIFLGATLFAQKKMGKRVPKEPFRLIYILSIATIVWGVITGTYFGYARIAQLPFLNRMVIGEMDSFASNNGPFMMYFCFIIGIVHLSVAHAINAAKIINSPRALGEFGWIGILWAVFFLVGYLVAGKSMPSFTLPLLIFGILLALVFSNFQKNIVKGVGTTMIRLPLSVIGSFSDMMSYLRLFAVGFASLTVASSFNDIAIGSGIDTFLKGFLAAVVLFFGHALNIALGIMAVLVHGVRLNMLEFSGHLSMQWSGKEYRPFRE